MASQNIPADCPPPAPSAQELLLPDHADLPALLAQLQKSTLTSGLAAGLAHEVNSPLSAISQGMQNLTRRLDLQREQNLLIAEQCGCNPAALDRYLRCRGIPGIVDAVRQSAERAATLVNVMLGFSRRKGAERADASVAGLIERSLTLANLDPAVKQALFKDGVVILQEYDQHLPLLHCHSTEIEQVLLNLIKNAIQAMQENPAEAKRMILRISAHSRNNRLYVDLADTGPGVPETLRQNIFAPFVTTKAEGTGLGLFIARYIMEVHGGSISVSPEPGGGAVFTLCFPV